MSISTASAAFIYLRSSLPINDNIFYDMAEYSSYCRVRRAMCYWVASDKNAI